MALPEASVAERPVALPPSAESAAMPDQPIQSLTHDDFLVSIANDRRSLREACGELQEIISITRKTIFETQKLIVEAEQVFRTTNITWTI